MSIGAQCLAVLTGVFALSACDASRMCDRSLGMSIENDSIKEKMGQATTLHHGSQVAEAAALYAEVLASDPDHAEANHLLGLAMHQLGDTEGGLPLLERGIELNPTDASYYSNCGSALKSLGRNEEALQRFEKSMELDDQFLPAFFNVGEIYCIFDRFADAEQAYRRASELGHDVPDVWSNLGVCLAKQEKWDEAAGCLNRTLSLDPRSPSAFYGLGHIYEKQMRFEESLDCYQEALACGFPETDCLCRLAEVCQSLSLNDQARQYLERIIEAGAADENVYNNLALIHQDLGETELAYAAIEKALSLEPNCVEALCTKSSLLNDDKRFSSAAELASQAASLDPQSAAAYNNLGNAYRGQALLDEARQAYERTIALDPSRAGSYSNLALVLQKFGEIEAMRTNYAKALELAPESTDIRTNYASALIEQGSLSQAEALLREAISLDDGHIASWSNLGRALYELGRFEESRQAYLAVQERKPEDLQSLVALSATQIANDTLPDERLFAYHQAAAQAIEAARSPLSPPTGSSSSDGKLRIGFVSADFKIHSVAYFLLPLFEQIDRARYEIHCYSAVDRPDESTVRFESLADGWHPIGQQSAAVTAEGIRSDGIDILFDLAGYTAGNCLEVFALKPAPVQINWLGYAHSTGFTRMDYRIGDLNTDPEGVTLNSETVLRLPETFICYQPPAELPPVAPPPSEAEGHVTFGSFNNIVKLSETSIRLFAAALAAVPGSRLVLKSHQTQDSAIQQRVWKLFQDQGIAADRIDLAPRFASLREHFKYYGQIDVALDTYPYNGTTTTCEALAMGVPVITLRGSRHASRVGGSLLSSVGLEDLIAEDEKSFAVTAATLATDVPRLSALRGELRERLFSSPLGDAPRFARSMEAALQSCGTSQLQ